MRMCAHSLPCIKVFLDPRQCFSVNGKHFVRFRYRFSVDGGHFIRFQTSVDGALVSDLTLAYHTELLPKLCSFVPLLHIIHLCPLVEDQ